MSNTDTDFSGNYLHARRKMNEGADMTMTTPVPFGDETIEMTHRLLSESELMKVQSEIDQEALREHRVEDETEEEERLRELQQKDELSEKEEKEFNEVAEAVQRQQSGIMNSLGYDTFKAFMTTGKMALRPSDNDIQDVFQLDPERQKAMFDTVPNTREEVEELLIQDMRETVESQPYPVKFIVGQTAYAESMKLFGDVDEGKLPDQ